MFKEYQQACELGRAILFMVFRGKLSEGFDFKDNLARGLFIIGVPNSNLGSIEMKTKALHYLKKNKIKGFIENNAIHISKISANKMFESKDF